MLWRYLTSIASGSSRKLSFRRWNFLWSRRSAARIPAKESGSRVPVYKKRSRKFLPNPHDSSCYMTHSRELTGSRRSFPHRRLLFFCSIVSGGTNWTPDDSPRGCKRCWRNMEPWSERKAATKRRKERNKEVSRGSRRFIYLVPRLDPFPPLSPRSPRFVFFFTSYFLLCSPSSSFQETNIRLSSPRTHHLLHLSHFSRHAARLYRKSRKNRILCRLLVRNLRYHSLSSYYLVFIRVFLSFFLSLYVRFVIVRIVTLISFYIVVIWSFENNLGRSDQSGSWLIYLVYGSLRCTSISHGSGARE